ncbi:MAG TPA: histidine kinase N-terminal 7TM domain-containing protein [Anaerolineales bacterium]|nr:histidine kinase N-terminal 7TM domain-containing protein [Anaerolineales bacterium]
MFNGWLEGLLAGLQTLNNILTAGIAITAFSLLLYALSFNLRDRVARSFAIILICVVVVFTTEALQNKSVPDWGIELLLRLQWVGIIFLPPSYLHLSDALLVTAGRPSRGRRRIAVRLIYILSVGFLVLLALGMLVGPLVPDGKPAPHLGRTAWTQVFTVYYLSMIAWAGYNFIRAYSRMLTRSGRRRMIYLMAGATAPALGSYPYLLFGSNFAAQNPLLFWGVAFVINLLVAGLVVIMAYAVAFFGVSWPDRVVKSRLFKWLLRGPITASLALMTMTIVRRAGELFGGEPYTGFVPLVVVATVLLFEHAVTLFSPLWERLIFYGRDRAELQLLQNIEERLLTRSDLQQFLETVLAAVRDHLQSPCAFVAALDGEELSLSVVAGNRSLLEDENINEALHVVHSNGETNRQEYTWGDFSVLPLRQRKENGDRDEVPPLLGLLGIARKADRPMDKDQRDSLWLLADRAALALEDRLLQQRVFRSLEVLQPQIDLLQRMRAVGRYDSRASLLIEPLPHKSDLADWVKDALTHYWGGPKLTNSPLMKLRIVQILAEEYDGNAPNALRALLRKAVDQVKPQGDRRFTSEWILYNILEMKFIEGRKVREVAGRLAMSEADLYRKQRVAVEVVARAILDMEQNEGANSEE